MDNATNLPGTAVLADTKAMIDGLKSVCASAGLANDSSEYKIITEAFLYKYLNDKFLYELKKLDEFKGAGDIEARFAAMGDDEREMLKIELDADTAYLRPEYLIPSLFNRQDMSGFAKEFDDALVGIAADNVDIFSVRTGQGQAINLFSGVTRFIVEEGKRDSFAKQLVNKLAAFSFERAFDEKYDFFAAVFEYLISDYNKDSGTYGEYFTPHSIATIIARILVPDGASDVTVYDPAAGTGTLVLAAAHRIGEDNCTIYTQDRSQKANEFMRLNLILNNLTHSLPNVIHDDTLENPRHLEKGGKALKRFDYIVSNPPFKADFSDTRDKLAGAAYRKRFWAGVPNITSKPEKMEIYLMFLQHIVASMKQGGHAAVVVPTGFLTAKGRIPLGIRKRMVDDGLLRGVVSMPSNIFANTGTNVSIVFLDGSAEHDNAILMDASKLGTKKKLDSKNQRTFLSDAEIDRIVGAFNAGEEQEDFSVVASYGDIEAKGYSFSAGQYFEVKIDYVDITPEEFDAELARRMNNLAELFAEENRLQAEIEAQLKKVRLG
ncbi:class I SAM-dependent DNA methyltransferase [Adlercreutzia sp. ZJ473]|uniref:HsdM family class I SAM-dependent methyltransferase n=1 Tax=Adlercreutzia sp. ZJ473 TaxID=2722822 RepID=UPI001551DD32|nr:class I SAM-dependent DNA methyltransferase [Adlercreutzia sp. ZJ473]